MIKSARGFFEYIHRFCPRGVTGYAYLTVEPPEDTIPAITRHPFASERRHFSSYIRKKMDGNGEAEWPYCWFENGCFDIRQFN
jgi:hypothetical protein